MTRPCVLIATTQPAMAYALRERLDKPCREMGLRLEVCPQGDEHAILGVRSYASAEALFDALSHRDPMALADTLVVLDLGATLEAAFRPAVSGAEGWHVTMSRRTGVAVELLLRFPQVFPVFLSVASPVNPLPTSGGRADNEWRTYSRLRESLDIASRENGGQKRKAVPLDQSVTKTLLALQSPLHFVSPFDNLVGLLSTLRRFARGMRCWFDPTGLRTQVKNMFLGCLFGDLADWSNTSGQRLVLRKRLTNVAVAVDEEREFALLSAYTAWKYGRRAWLVTTYAEFQEGSVWTNGDDGIVLRDIDLCFPDIPESPSGIRTKLRDVTSNQWETKVKEDWHVRVVSGADNIVNAQPQWMHRLWEKMQMRLGQTRGVNPNHVGFPKPISSLYELAALLGPKATSITETTLAQLHPRRNTGRDSTGHGAPYLNLAIAEQLLRQARRCNGGSSEHLIAALLASEAYELLLGMSKTTAMEALLVLHTAEVRAEVSYPGVELELNTKTRKKDIEKTIKRLSLGAKSRQSFLSQFWAELRIAYRSGESFAAAESANSESLINGGTRWIRRPFLMIATSPRSWFLASALMVFGMTFMYKAAIRTPASCWAWYSYSCDWANHWNLIKFFLSVALSSVTLQPMTILAKMLDAEPPEAAWVHAVAILHMSLAYLLFGLLLSMIYRKVTRG